MSEENVEVVRQIFPGNIDMVALFDDPDLLAAMRAGIEPFVEPAFETVGDPEAIAMGSGTGVEAGSDGVFARGIEGFLNFWRDWNTAWDTWQLGTPEFVDVDADRVLVSYDVLARSKTDRVELTFKAANLITLREGKLTRLELFFDHVKAFQAAGLSE
jgi:hypothetical protein